jgi:hypothetical protein
VINYRATRFEDVVHNVTFRAVDTVGVRSPSAPNRCCAMAAGRRQVQCRRRSAIDDGSCAATPPWDVKGGLEAVGPLIAAGKVRINIDQTYPLDAIAQAQEQSQRRTRGKVVATWHCSATSASLAYSCGAARMRMLWHTAGCRVQFSSRFYE